MNFSIHWSRLDKILVPPDLKSKAILEDPLPSLLPNLKLTFQLSIFKETKPIHLQNINSQE